MRELLTRLSSATLSAAGDVEGEGGSMTVEEGVCLMGDGLDGVTVTVVVEVVAGGRFQGFSFSPLVGPSSVLFFLESTIPGPLEEEEPFVSMLLPPAPTPAPNATPPDPAVPTLSSTFKALTGRGRGSLLVSSDPISEGTGDAEGLGAGLDTITAGATSCSDFQSDTGTGTGDTVRGGRGRG